MLKLCPEPVCTRAYQISPEKLVSLMAVSVLDFWIHER